MNANQRAAVINENEIDFIDLWWIVWDRRVLVAVTTVICALVALVLALTATPIYRATAVLTEVTETGLNADTGIAGEVGGLASLAGLSLGLNGPHPERAATLRSRHLVDEFVKRKDVLPVLLVGAKPGTSVWMAVERFRKNVLDIQDDKLKATTTVTMDWVDPAVAARWVDEFVALANDELRNKAIADASRNVAYLEDQVQHTNSVEIQKVMYNLIEQQTKSLMLAKGRTEYAFAVVDPPVTAEVRVSPKRTLMVLSGIAVGFFLGSYIAWLRTRFAARRRRLATATAADGG